MLPDKKSFAVSDAAGRFSGDPGDDWPPFLKVSYPGFAETTVAVPTTRADADLPPVFLEKGGRLELSIDRATATLGYVPAVDLDTGLRRTATWYRENGYL